MATRPGSLREVSFGGRPGIIVPAGAPVVSDPVEMASANTHDLIVSLYLPEAAQQSQAGNGVLVENVAGRDATHEPDPLDAKSVAVRPLVSAIYNEAAEQSRTVVALGDSITDGAMSSSLEERGWPGTLAVRLSKAVSKVQYSVSNQGIGGNRLLTNGLGLNALGRFGRDVLSQPNVSVVIVLEHINDIGFGAGGFGAPGRAVISAELIVAYQQLIARAHAHKIKMIGGTLTPFRGSFYFSDEREQTRLEVNEWIRNNRQFDGIIDFDQAVRDKSDPSKLAAGYDSGDRLHPNDAGYAAMAGAIDLKLFPGALLILLHHV